MTAPGTAQGPLEAIELVQFSMLGCWAGVAASQVAPVRSDAAHSGVVAVESLVGMAPAHPPEASKRLLLRVKVGPVGGSMLVGVDSAADLVQMSCALVHPLPALLVGRHQLRGLRALGWYEDGRDDPLVLLFDWSEHNVE